MCFWRRLKHRCFPKAVLPQGSYIPKMEVQDVLNTTPSLLVARRMDAPFNHCVSKEGNVYYMSLDSLGEKRHLAQMSLDLLGACYYPDKHQRYRTKNVGNNPWDGETIYRFAPRDMFEYYSGECCSVAMEASKLMDAKTGRPVFFAARKAAASISICIKVSRKMRSAPALLPASMISSKISSVSSSERSP